MSDLATAYQRIYLPGKASPIYTCQAVCCHGREWKGEDKGSGSSKGMEVLVEYIGLTESLMPTGQELSKPRSVWGSMFTGNNRQDAWSPHLLL
jgi:hypothetical protein